MKIKYREGNPTINIRIKGPEGKEEYKAYLDTGAGRTLIPERDAVKLGLEYVGDTEIITGSGKDHIKLYKATVTFLNKDFSVLVLGRDLPEQANIKAIVGRDILDKHKVCFDGIRKEIEITLSQKSV